MQIMTHAVPEKNILLNYVLCYYCAAPYGGAVQLIVSGHIFNGDFALYIRQAQSIQYGDMQQVFSDMQEMIAHSTYQRYSPILYPWGYPLLLFPCVVLFGINYFAFKIVGVICLVGAFIFLYYHPILSKERFQNVRPTRFSFADRQHILLGVC